MSVLDRSALESSPLADLHAIASELGIDSYRRLRRETLVEEILSRGGGETAAPQKAATRRRKAEAADEDVEALSHDADAEAPADQDDEPEARPARRGRGRGRGREESREAEGEPAEEKAAEGVVELLGNGSAFLRLNPPEPSDEDVYVSAAQVRRCELVSGDRVAGPVRPPRRSERYPSLVRVETINGLPAEEVAGGARYDELPADYPRERLALGGEDPTVKAIEWLTPFGKGSRVTITGASRAGKSEALRRIAEALTHHEDIELQVVLAGVRPEEIAEWQAGPVVPAGATSFAASGEAQGQAVEHVVEQAKRIAARGGDAVVLIDTLDGLNPSAARRALAAARNVREGGSLTILATAREPAGGETTVIALDAALTSMHRFPALDLESGGTIRPELLVGEAGAEAIAKARAEAAED